MTAAHHAGSDFRWDIPEAFNFGEIVDHWAEQAPDRTALIAVDAEDSDTQLSFLEVAERSNQVANLLAAIGITAGDRVLVVLPRGADWHLTMVACMKLGAVPVPCITMLTANDLRYRVTNCTPRAVVTTAAHITKFAPGEPAIRVCVGDAPSGWTDFAEYERQPRAFRPVKVLAEQPAVIFYTSGSTGPPKGVTLAARSIYAWRTAAVHWLALEPGELVWCTADTGWSKAACSTLFGPWTLGSTTMVHDAPFRPQDRLDLIERLGVNVFCAPATEFRRLILEDLDRWDLSSLRIGASAGESVSPEVIEAWTASARTPLLDGYGQTENLMTVANRVDRPIKPGSMGQPLPGVELAVLTTAGDVDPGPATGQLILRCPNPQLMLGYWNDEERTKEAYATVDGVQWFLTGDNVGIDDDRYLTFIGRVDDVIGSSGYRIGPQEVENVLLSHPAVLEVAVVAHPDPERGAVVKAFVVLPPGQDGTPELVAELQAHTKARTAPYKYPRLIEFVDALPRTPTGKIRRDLLRVATQGAPQSNPGT